MKKIILCISLFLIAAAPSFAEDVIPSSLTEVTLFSNQAQITREAVVQAKKGMNEFLFEVEAFRVDKDSVSTKIFGQGEIYGVQFKDVHQKESPQRGIRELERKIKDLKRTIKSSENKKDIIRKSEDFLDSLVDFSKTQIPEDMKTRFPEMQDLRNTLIFLAGELEELRKQKELQESSIQEKKEELEILEKELSQLRNKRHMVKRVIEILFNSKKDQSLRIVMSYVAGNAYWRPLYTADVPLDLEAVDLKMFAKIRQKTGEDWQDAVLRISNIIPLRGVDIPSPGIWSLDMAVPRTAYKRSAGALRMEKSLLATQEAESVPLAEDMVKEADIASASRKELPLSFEYTLPRKISIESVDKDTIVPLLIKRLKGDFFYHSVPRVNALTFLVCRTSADKELLGGPLNVHFGGRFVGKTFLSEKKVGQEFDLNLGADREIKVKREKIKDKIKETYFGKIQRSTIVRELAYKITLENLKQKPVRIETLDSIPVSRTDKIVVKDLSVNPEPKEKNYQDKEGVMLWEFEIEPGGKKEIDIEFVVTYPKDEPVSGL